MLKSLVPWLATAICLLTFIPAAAQERRGTIAGTAADSSGARLPGVIVEVSTAGSPSRSVATLRTDADGAFITSRLPSGEYIVRFALDGFTPAERRVRVDTDAPATADATLEIGGV